MSISIVHKFSRRKKIPKVSSLTNSVKAEPITSDISTLWANMSQKSAKITFVQFYKRTFDKIVVKNLRQRIIMKSQNQNGGLKKMALLAAAVASLPTGNTNGGRKTMNRNRITAADTDFAVTVEMAKNNLIQIGTTYLDRVDGELLIPFERQRPVILLGPAGVGKTDLAKQVAEALDIGFVAYSLPHHTRQSISGLPKIVEKSHNGETALTTEYTQSEIIASVYDYIEKTGKKNGILFLDEVNCISDTLHPLFLQLCQQKTLGQCTLPEGWILIMAGNPPQYNKSVKEFDAVTRDRLRIINVVPDADAWLDYADQRGLNPTVTAFIRSDKSKIYGFEPDRAQIVTPRGWEELSMTINSFEKHGYEITPELISQFIGIPSTANEFYSYHKMVKENVTEKDIDNIIRGKTTDAYIKKVRAMQYGIRFMFMSCLKSRLHAFAVDKDYQNGSSAMDCIVDFLTNAYGTDSETELFMNGILSDKDIVQMAVLTKNGKFGAYLDEITESETNINNDLRKIRKKED